MRRKVIILPALILMLLTLGLKDPGSKPVIIKMKGMSFVPKVIEISEGTTVYWVNESNYSHNVVSPEAGIKSRLMGDGEAYQFKFAKSGTYKYYCQPHRIMGMKGVIVVNK